MSDARPCVMVRGAISRNGVSVCTCLTEQVASVRGDRVQLQQLVMNLIFNSVKAISGGEAGARQLSINIDLSNILVVRDADPGVDPEYVERIFALFYTTKTSGMGLSICRSIVEGHAGPVLGIEYDQP